MNLKYYTNFAKGLKLKVRRFYGLVSTFVEVTGDKLVGSLLPRPSQRILNSVKLTLQTAFAKVFIVDV